MAKCPHPPERLQPTILNPDNPDLAYCPACLRVLRRVDGVWVPDSVPGQITRVTTRRG